jgi:hypothetical protein
MDLRHLALQSVDNVLRPLARAGVRHRPHLSGQYSGPRHVARVGSTLSLWIRRPRPSGRYPLLRSGFECLWHPRAQLLSGALRTLVLFQVVSCPLVWRLADRRQALNWNGGQFGGVSQTTMLGVRSTFRRAPTDQRSLAPPRRNECCPARPGRPARRGNGLRGNLVSGSMDRSRPLLNRRYGVLIVGVGIAWTTYG